MQYLNSPLTTEYKVRPVVRYLVTRFVPYWDASGMTDGMNSSGKLCEVESEMAAEELVMLLNRSEAERIAVVLAQDVQPTSAPGQYNKPIKGR